MSVRRHFLPRLPGAAPILALAPVALCWSVAPAAAQASQSATPVNQAATAGDTTPQAVLRRQIEFWLAQHQPDRAAEALDRLVGMAGISSAEAADLGAAIRAERTSPAPERLATAPLPAPPRPLAAASQKADATPGSADPRTQLAISEAVLRRDPDDLEARVQAFRAALSLHDMASAEILASDVVRRAPYDPRAWFMTAELDRARGNQDLAQRDMQTARKLQREQPDGDAGEQVASATPATGVAANRPSELVLVESELPRQDASASELRQDGPALAGSAVAQAGQPPGADPLAQEINQQIARVKTELAPQADIEPSFSTRSGQAGLGQLVDFGTKLSASFSPGGVGRLTVAVTPTLLQAGTLSSGNKTQFGSAILGSGSNAMPGRQSAAGVGLDVAYARNWFKADIGSTPLGFPVQNVTGGVQLSPRLTDNLTLNIIGERRPVTDSLLAFAGTTDPSTRKTWGGVMRTRGYAQLQLAVGRGELHAGGGYDWLAGTNVASNQELEFDAGGSYPVWHDGKAELRTGAELVYFSYQKSLDYFTLGQGGYFSPQSYVAGIIPLRYTVTDDKFSWSISGQAGYQTYHNNASPLFPNDTTLQNQLQARVAAETGGTAFYPSASVSGLVGGGGASFSYHITPSWIVGGQASFEYTGNYREAEATIFSRFVFDDGL